MRLFKAAERKAEAIIDEMKKRYDKDIELYRKKQLACKKLNYIDDLSKELKNVSIPSSRSTCARSFWSSTGWSGSRSGSTRSGEPMGVKVSSPA